MTFRRSPRWLSHHTYAAPARTSASLAGTHPRIGIGLPVSASIRPGDYIEPMQTKSSAVRRHIGWGVVEGVDELRHVAR